MDTKRLRTALAQDCQQNGLPAELVGDVVHAMEKLIAVTGNVTAGRVAALRVARVLLHTELAPTIIAPSCPDYAHRDGVYTFDGLGRGVALLTQRHIGFLDDVTTILPHARVEIWLADQEAHDPELYRRCGVSEDEFTDRVQSSLETTRLIVASRGWGVRLMTEAVPHFTDRAGKEFARITQDCALARRLSSETIDRASMYRRLNPRLTMEDWRLRTARTAAQYVTLGRHAAEQRAVICNHTTTNLAWYADAGAAVLHNPVRVY